MGKPLQGASSLAFYLRAYFSTHAFARLFFTQTEAPYKGFPIPSGSFLLGARSCLQCASSSTTSNMMVQPWIYARSDIASEVVETPKRCGKGSYTGSTLSAKEDLAAYPRSAIMKKIKIAYSAVKRLV